MAGVSITQVAKAVWSSRREQASALMQGGQTAFDYSFRDFLLDVRRAGLLKDRMTIRDRWDWMIDEEYLTRERRTKFGDIYARFEFSRFAAFMDKSERDLLQAVQSGTVETYTIIESEVSE